MLKNTVRFMKVFRWQMTRLETATKSAIGELGEQKSWERMVAANRAVEGKVEGEIERLGRKAGEE